ncbi:NAD(P)-binding protein [Mycena rebaudengoi]|nr:NAD(P)-binding protein [Mycena rebaudengoi]
MGNFIAKIAPTSELSTDFWPPTSTFTPERDIPDLSGTTALVTGGNTGIGYHTVKQLLLKNAKVYLAARSAEKGAEAIRRLEEETKRTAIFIQLDLADLRSVRKAADAFLAQESRLDLLFNNGGVMISPTEQLTAQKHDLQFGTNVIGHYFLTELLIPALAASQRATNIPARVINTSSSGHKFAPTGTIDFASLRGGPARDALIKKWGSFRAPWKLYGESKLGNIIVSNHLAKAHADILVSCALHPGGIRTELQRHAAGWMQQLSQLMLYPAPMGAYTQLWAGTTASPAQINGEYLIPWARIGRAAPSASNTKLEEDVIAYLKEQVEGY